MANQKSKQQIIDELQAHITEQGGEYSDWYCGITKDIKSRVYSYHKVLEKNHWYMTRGCKTNTIAREIEEHFLDLECEGDTGGGDEESTIVYIYLMTSETNP